MKEGDLIYIKVTGRRGAGTTGAREEQALNYIVSIATNRAIIRKTARPPYCFCCKKDGHKSSVCPEKKGLRVCGFGLPGQGFYSIRVPIKEKTKKGARG